MTETASITGSRDFRIFWVGEGTSKFSSAMTVVAVPLVATQTLAAGPLLVGVIEAVTWLPWLVIGLLVGAWVDRVSRWRVMIAADLVSVVALGSVPLAAAFGLLTIWQLMVVAVVLGGASVFYSTAYSAYLPVLFPAMDLASANGKLMGTEKAAQVAGPGLAGLIMRVVAPAGVLLVNAVTFLVSALCLCFLRREEPHVRALREGGADRTGRLWRDIGEGIRFVRTNVYLRTLTLYAAASNLVAGALQAVLVVFLLRTVHLDATVIGLVLGALGAGGIVGAFLAAPLTRSLGSARAIVASEACMPFALLMPLAQRGFGLALLIGGGTMVSAGIVASNVISATFLQTYCPPRMMGRVSAATRVVNFGTLPVGALLGGVLGTAIGLRPTMLVIAISLTLSPLILLFSPISRLRDLPGADHAQACGLPAHEVSQ
ncbi:MFS transporter [Amycolatopsis taiwanensis]|uniref:MFS transporter n=1 Tax=Amycolatopsis taiwanensis TaxID=342230 RepID=UPI000481C2FA|nr:MFS transporter [Amycolatopsis taiwanensis]